jgi:hypothetical protein
MQTISIGAGSSNQCPAQLTQGTLARATDASSIAVVGANTQSPEVLTQSTVAALPESASNIIAAGKTVPRTLTQNSNFSL